MFNKKGSMGDTVFTLVIIMLLFFGGSLFVNPLKDSVTSFRNDVHCSTPDSISDGTKLLCLGGDVTVPYFIILLFSIMGGLILTKFVI